MAIWQFCTRTRDSFLINCIHIDKFCSAYISNKMSFNLPATPILWGSTWNFAAFVRKYLVAFTQSSNAAGNTDSGGSRKLHTHAQGLILQLSFGPSQSVGAAGPPYRQPVNHIHHHHLLSLLSPKADTHFTVPQRVEGWVDLGGC